MLANHQCFSKILRGNHCQLYLAKNKWHHILKHLQLVNEKHVVKLVSCTLVVGMWLSNNHVVHKQMIEKNVIHIQEKFYNCQMQVIVLLSL
jgi:hypothetical protein